MRTLALIVTVFCALAAFGVALAWGVCALSTRRERAEERALLAAWNRDHATHTPPPTWQPRRNDPEVGL